MANRFQLTKDGAFVLRRIGLLPVVLALALTGPARSQSEDPPLPSAPGHDPVLAANPPEKTAGMGFGGACAAGAV
jgi:hypothetical protein